MHGQKTVTNVTHFHTTSLAFSAKVVWKCVTFVREQFLSSASKTLHEHPGHVCRDWCREVSYTTLSKHVRDAHAKFSWLSSETAQSDFTTRPVLFWSVMVAGSQNMLDETAKEKAWSMFSLSSCLHSRLATMFKESQPNRNVVDCNRLSFSNWMIPYVSAVGTGTSSIKP